MHHLRRRLGVYSKNVWLNFFVFINPSGILKNPFWFSGYSRLSHIRIADAYIQKENVFVLYDHINLHMASIERILGSRFISTLQLIDLLN